MANPQLENGYTSISNEIMDAICKMRIPGEARQVMDFILRKTYGWHKKEDQISLSQFSEGTGLSKVHVCRAIDTLLKMKIITKKGNALSLFTKKGKDETITYGLQKDFEKWASLPKKVTLPKKVIDVTQKGNRTLPKKGTTKETITKETNTKTKHPLCPSFISPQSWADFCQHRKAKRSPLTPKAMELIFKKLETWKAEKGWSPDDILNQSIENGWTGIFELKEKSKEDPWQQHRKSRGL